MEQQRDTFKAQLNVGIRRNPKLRELAYDFSTLPGDRANTLAQFFRGYYSHIFYTMPGSTRVNPNFIQSVRQLGVNLEE